MIYKPAEDNEMPNYQKLRELVSHRVVFDYDTGARVVGYVSGVRPASGPALVVMLSRADILDDKGRVIEHHDELSIVPNVLTGFRLQEGPS
jgi:hypothetical protein